jgi:hypothetical protein
VIKFYFKLGKTATEVYQDLKHVYGNVCLSRAQVFRWFASFQEGRESLEDEPCSGRLVSPWSNKNVEKARAIVIQDWRISFGYSLNVLESVRKRPPEFWKEICRKGSFVRSLCRTLKQFLASKSICVIQHPPYTPEFASADFFLFPKVKLALKEARFSEISDIQPTEKLKGVSLQDFQRAFKDVYKRSDRCVELDGRLYRKSVINIPKYIHSFYRNKYSLII